ncbi:MAG: phosphoribosylaminoimidazolecarboxamide formyltransferase / cyclohydrolase [Patescibacteria group bacterium]|nr:phosphoribosylaminoimidazolecarboxamide formyltransferase / cyclohydrolase [Patescibacteria group bacterium]
MQPSAVKAFKPKAGNILRILVSTTDKSGLAKLKPLIDRGSQIVTTGGTATELRKKHGFPCTDVSEVTGFPEILNGRVKLLHPKMFAGLLAEQGTMEHLDTIAEHGIDPFHAVFINLYDFFGKPGIDQIDVGGPAALRAAAKNGLVVVIDVSDYDRVIQEMCASEDGTVSSKLRNELIVKVFRCTSEYDSAIADWLEEQGRLGIDPFASVNLSSH